MEKMMLNIGTVLTINRITGSELDPITGVCAELPPPGVDTPVIIMDGRGTIVEMSEGDFFAL